MMGNLYNRQRPYESLYNYLVYHARRRSQLVGLSYDDFLLLVKIRSCHYCGDSILWEKFRGKATNRTNIDRKENSLGYTLDNCVVCCYGCNRTKGYRFTY